MRTSRSSVVMPLPVRHALRKLGRDIRDARRRRRIPAAIAAQRASISRTTLVKIEKGDPGVAIGIYATVLFVLGMADRLGDLAAPKNDPVGLQLEETCRSAFAWRAGRSARKTSDGQRGSRLGSKDNETRSYLEIVDALRQHGAAPQADMDKYSWQP